MDPHPRSAQKRRHPVAASNERDDDWTAPSGGSQADSSETSSQFDTLSADSDPVELVPFPPEEVLLYPPERTEFSSWESFHDYLYE